MSAAVVSPPPLTGEAILAMPDDGVERWIVRGKLRERPMTLRNRWHGRTTARIAQILGNWLDRQPNPRGEILDGEAGCRLRRNPETFVGIDVMYISPELAASEPDDTSLIDGVPTLVVEVLSPSDTQEDINEKVDEYLAVGVPIVWLVDPHHRTIEVHRPDAKPTLFNEEQEIIAEPHLPGFRAAVASIFQR